MSNGVLWAMAVALVAGLQAWDSGVLRSTALVQVLVGLAIVVPAAAIAGTQRYGVQAAAIACAFVLLTVARVIAPGPLPTLHLIAFIPAMVVFLGRTIRRPENTHANNERTNSRAI